MLFSNSNLSKIVKYRRPWNSPQYSKEEFFCIKILKFRELFSFYTSHKFTSYRMQQHYFTKNSKKEKQAPWQVKSSLIKFLV